MNTQNVNTAAPESTERCGQTTSLRMDGFISDISSSHPFDVVRADVVISRLEVQAHAGCGLHYEIYESRLISKCIRSPVPPADERPAGIYRRGRPQGDHAFVGGRRPQSGGLP